MKKNIAIYAGTFDPITLGHVDLVERAALIFDCVVIGIANSEKKKPLFHLEERLALTQKVIAHLPNVKVLGFHSLLLDFAKAQQASVIIRGLRTVTDFDYEFQLASMNRYLDNKIETLFLMPAEKYMYVSSTLVREIAYFGGDVSGFVPALVAEALAQKVKQ